MRVTPFEIRREYWAARADGAKASHALDYARYRAGVCRAWRLAERAGLVRLVAIADEYASWDDIAGDCFEPEHAEHLPGGLRTLNAQRNAFKHRIEREGAAGIVGFYRLDPAHEDADPYLYDFDTATREGWEEQGGACWGFVGGDATELIDGLTDYALDIAEETLDALRAALRERGRRFRAPTCPTCGQRAESLR